MKKLFALLILSCITLGGWSQRAKVAEKDVLQQAQEAMQAYDFDRAIKLLDDKIAKEKAKRKNKQPTIMEEALLQSAIKNKLLLGATEVVTIIDSVVVPKKEVFNTLKLSDESGKVYSFKDYFNKPDDMDCSVFVNQLGNTVLYAAPDKTAHLRIYRNEMIGEEWKQGEMVNGLVNEDADDVNYPFLMGDGITLYFGAQRGDGLGGYDIYMTRYDSDEHTFLTAENIGMPFNSPANDYLMVIDDYYQLGFFVTDRNQPADTVCVYTFIPNETRRIYQEDLTEHETLKSRARIDRIADTWTNMAETNKAKERLRAMREEANKDVIQKDFEFVINDRRTCSKLTDFKNAQAKEKAKQWQECMTTYTEGQKKLDGLRLKYALAITNQKNQLAPEIRVLERDVEASYLKAKALEVEIRQLEQ
ncbi:MAG: hypothetical protein HUK03_03600 [Bacteroidaceae bacterium]|nr:hypothetical protein [Bacteroidaceae bacterium]